MSEDSRTGRNEIVSDDYDYDDGHGPPVFKDAMGPDALSDIERRTCVAATEMPTVFLLAEVRDLLQQVVVLLQEGRK